MDASAARSARARTCESGAQNKKGRETMRVIRILTIIAALSLLSVPSASSQLNTRVQRWKTYEASNGARFRVNIASIQRIAIGVMVMGQAIGVDPSPYTIVFNCRGYYTVPGNEDTGWQLAPSRSVIGAIAKDVCARR